MVIYVLLQVAYIGSINWANAGVAPGNWAALATSSWATLPLKYAVAAGSGAFFAFFAAVLLFDSWLSPSGTGWIYLGTSTRTLYGLSIEGYFPKGLHALHERFRIPWVALIVSVIIGIAFLAPLPSWYELVAFISSTSALTYVTGGAMIPAFRKYAGGLHRPFKLPLPWLFAGLSFVASALVLFWSGFGTMTWVLITVDLGIGLYLLYAAPLKMGIGWGVTLTLSVVTFVVLGVLAYFGPMYAAGQTVPNTILWSATNSAPDIAYFAIFGALTILMPVILWGLVKPEFKRHFSAAFWIPIWMFAFYVVSYFTEFGPAGFPNGQIYPFPDGTYIAIVLGAVFFVWAALSAFETDEMKAMVAMGGVVKAEDEEEKDLTEAPGIVEAPPA
jgi:hypothetical protein